MTIFLIIGVSTTSVSVGGTIYYSGHLVWGLHRVKALSFTTYLTLSLSLSFAQILFSVRFADFSLSLSLGGGISVYVDHRVSALLL